MLSPAHQVMEILGAFSIKVETLKARSCSSNIAMLVTKTASRSLVARKMRRLLRIVR